MFIAGLHIRILQGCRQGNRAGELGKASIFSKGEQKELSKEKFLF